MNHYVIVNELFLNTTLTSHFQLWQCSKMAVMLRRALGLSISFFINPCLYVPDKTTVI